VFNYNFGMLPHRKAIVSVSGEPIPVEQCEEPTSAQIDQLHETYIQHLEALYNKYKDVYAKGRKSDMRFVR